MVRGQRLTPYVSVNVDAHAHLPHEHVREGEIVLNVGHDAVHKPTIGNDLIQFAARFGGVAREIRIRSRTCTRCTRARPGTA